MIDSHQHFWKYNSADYPWMSDSMTTLKSDHEPSLLKPLMERTGVIGTVAVQARQMRAETDYLLTLARQHSWILGVVGWLDFSAQDLHAQIDRYASDSNLSGLRELIHDMPDKDYAISPVHTRAIAILGGYDLVYDLLLRPAFMPAAIKLVDMFPNQRFVVDHIAKPEITTGRLDPWSRLIVELARRPNVFCKLSGMVTEANWNQWSAADLQPYVDICLEAFGPGRLMIGSDWPVCTLAGEYQTVMAATRDCLKTLSESEQQHILCGTCRDVYHLETGAENAPFSDLLK